jgi:hypothetical protein
MNLCGVVLMVMGTEIGLLATVCTQATSNEVDTYSGTRLGFGYLCVDTREECPNYAYRQTRGSCLFFSVVYPYRVDVQLIE